MNNLKQKIIFWVSLSILLGFVFFYGKYKNRSLLDNTEYSHGYVIKVRPGVVTGGGIQFRIIDVKTKYNLLMPWGNKCESEVKERLSEIKKIRFPVVFDKKDTSNAEILLFKSQYEKYGLEIPDSLQKLVNELSKCE
jgi:hypothetical protein